MVLCNQMSEFFVLSVLFIAVIWALFIWGVRTMSRWWWIAGGTIGAIAGTMVGTNYFNLGGANLLLPAAFFVFAIIVSLPLSEVSNSVRLFTVLLVTVVVYAPYYGSIVGLLSQRQRWQYVAAIILLGLGLIYPVVVWFTFPSYY